MDRKPATIVALVALRVLAVAGIALAPAWNASAQLRPLIREMMENLGSVNRIGEGIALNDYENVAKAGQDLKDRATQLRKVELTTLGLDPAQTGQFRRYMDAQVNAADMILAAAKKEDGAGTYRGLQKVFTDACLPCHTHFREAANLLTPATLFMTTLLDSWRDVYRGLAVNDFLLVARSSHEIAAMARVMSWDPIIEEVFHVEDPLERKGFRGMVHHVAMSASSMAIAASREDKPAIIEAAGTMWTEGCISCHEQFRD